MPTKKVFILFQFAIGLVLIFNAPKLSYFITSDFFISDGGGSYLMEHFVWMLKAFHISIVVLGVIICMPAIIAWNSLFDKIKKQ
ncbi:hypothetical protein [Caldicoprobacter faecalis]|uniref:Uncharacterized protein n=1 Tax=Caldicoprobacter faecalis TaxID=937334 RepID=A0A1I5YWM8_9FIRM|nr:hypothetical protein [Caldicoprobacter faecalis]SFQ48673.1 hypothetical protein SAMN05444406_1733 [Caldicoprobacter faecalis]